MSRTNYPEPPVHTWRRTLVFLIATVAFIGILSYGYFVLGIANPDKLSHEIPELTASNAASLIGGPLQANPPQPVFITICSGVTCDRQLPQVEKILGAFPNVKFLQYHPLANSTDPIDGFMNKVAGDTLPVSIILTSLDDLNKGPATASGYQSADDLTHFISQATASTETNPLKALVDVKTVSAGSFADVFAKDTAVDGNVVMVILCTNDSPLCVSQLQAADALVPAAAKAGIQLIVLHLDLSEKGAIDAAVPLLQEITFPKPIQAAEPITIVRAGLATAGFNGLIQPQTLGQIVASAAANSKTGFPTATAQANSAQQGTGTGSNNATATPQPAQ